MSCFKDLGPKAAVITFMFVMFIAAIFSALINKKALLGYLVFIGLTAAILALNLSVGWSLYYFGITQQFNWQFWPSLKIAACLASSLLAIFVIACIIMLAPYKLSKNNN